MNANERLYILVLLIFAIPLSVSAQLQQDISLYSHWNNLSNLAVKNNILAIAAEGNGCVFYDVNDPNNPEYLTRHPIIANDVNVINDYWIIRDWDRLEVVDFGGDGQPERIGYLELPDGMPQESAVYENYFAASTFVGPGQYGFYLFDMTDPINPNQLFLEIFNRSILDIAMDDEDIYLAFSDHIKLYSYSNNELTLLDSVGFDGSERVSLLLCESHLTVVVADYGLIKCSRSNQGQLVQYFVQELDLTYPQIVPWDENYFCLIDEYIRMIEVGESAYTIIDSIQINSPNFPVNSVKVGSSIYLGYQNWDNRPHCGYIIPLYWENEGFVEGELFNSYGETYEVESDGSLIAVLVNLNRIDIFDLTQPSQPVLQSSLGFGELFRNVALKNNILIIAEKNVGIHLYDLSNPQTPELISIIDFHGNMSDDAYINFLTFSIEDSIAIFTASGRTSENEDFSDLIVVDLSDLSDPTSYVWHTQDQEMNFDRFGAVCHPNGTQLILVYGTIWWDSVDTHTVLLVTRPEQGEVEVSSRCITENATLLMEVFVLDNYLCTTYSTGGHPAGTTIFNIDDPENVNIAYQTDFSTVFGGQSVEIIGSNAVFARTIDSFCSFHLNETGQINDTTATELMMGHFCISGTNSVAVSRLDDVIIYSGLANWLDVEEVKGVFPNNKPLTPNISLLAYPNPFNSSTIITCNLPTPGFYTLDIYNILAQKVATIHNGFLDAGPKKFHWHGFNENQQISSGTYYVILNGERRYSAKIQYIK